MNVSELRKALEGVDDNLQVRLVADHGQCAMKANGYGVSHINEYTYMADEIHEDDLGNWDDPIKVFIIEAF